MPLHQNKVTPMLLDKKLEEIDLLEKEEEEGEEAFKVEGE